MSYVIGSSKQFEGLAKEMKSFSTDGDVVDIDITVFSDGEHSVEYKSSLRGKTLFLLASTTHDSLIETLLLIDAAKRASAEKIVLVSPYLGYARQDRKEGVRGPLGAKLVADVLSVAGIDELVVLDLHAAQIQGFFNIPIAHLEGHTVFCPYLEALIRNDRENWVICTPDAGGFVRASKFAQKLGLSMVAINKRRDKPNSIGSMELVGDVTGKKVIIVDDIIDTAGTLSKASNYLFDSGAIQVHAVCTHPILSGKAIENLKTSKLTKLFVANSNMPTSVQKAILEDLPIDVISIAPALAKAIEAIANKKSVNLINL